MINNLVAAFIERETGAAHTGRTFEDAASNSRGLWQRMALDSLLVGHRGCVNHVEFSEQGTLLASGSDDTKLCLWDMQSSKPLTVNMTGHSQNIFCVKFMPTTSDSSQPLIATCAGDGEVRLHDLTSGSKSVYNHHMSRVKKLVTEPGNPNLIISCSEDGTVRQIDTREPARNSVQLLQLARNGVKLEINSISAPWHKPWLLAVGGSDDLLRVYDRRTAGTTAGSRPRITGPKCVAHFSPGSHSEAFSSDCITGVAFSDDGSQVLANYLGDYVYLWSVNDLIGSKLNLGQQHTAAAAASARKGKRARQDYSPGSTAAAAGDQKQASAHAAAADGLIQDSPAAAAAEGVTDDGDPDQMVLDDGSDDAAAAAVAAVDDEDKDDDDAVGAVPASRVLSVDAAVELLERGDLRLPRRRQGALASMILNRSQDLYERNEVEASLRYATAALRLRATFGMAHYQAAICHERLGNPAAALAAGEAALQYAWGYDLQQFVRRLSRSMQAAAAAEHGEQQQQQAQGDQQRERNHREQQIEHLDQRQEQQQQHDQQQQQHGRQQQQQQDGVRPLPPALLQRLQNRGILKAQDAAAAGAAEDTTNPPPPPPPPPSAAAAGDQSNEQQQRDEDMLDTETAAAAAADSGGLAAAAAASGGSESWSPSNNGGSSSSSSGQGSGSSSDRSGSSGSSSSSSGASDAEASSHSSPSTSTDGDHYMLVDVSGSERSSGSGSSDSSSSSSGGGSSSGGSSEDHEPGSDDEHFTSASDVSWLSDSESDEENELEDVLGLDVRHRIYDWGGQDAAAAAGSSAQQQQDPAANGIPSHYSDGENDDRNRFGEFLEPLRHQLLLLRARQQHRQQQRAAAPAWQQRVRAAAAGLRQEQQSKLRAEWQQMEREMWNEFMQQESGTAEQQQQQQQHAGQQQQLLAAAGEIGTGGDQVESLIDEELLGYIWMLAAQVLLPQDGGCQQPQQHQEQQFLQRGGEASDQQQQRQRQQQHVEDMFDHQQQQGAHRHQQQQQQQQQMQQQSTAASVDMPLALVLLPEPTDPLDNVVRLTDDRPPEEQQQQQQQQRIQHLQLQQAQLLSAVQWHFSGEDATQIRKQVAEVRVRCCMALQQLVAQWQQQQRWQQQHEVTSVLHDEQLQQQFKDLIEQYSSKIGDLCGQQIIKAHEQYQQMATAPANAGVAAAAAAGSGHVDQTASGSDSDSDSDDLSEIMEEEDLLDERDPIICELGKALAAGEFGGGSGSRSAAEQDEASAAAAGPNSSRTGAVLLDGSDAAAGAAAGGLRQHKWSCRYRGHVSLKTVKDVAFVGPGQTMVAAGSDDGRLYVWDRHTGELITALRADRYVVNCVAGHSNLPMMASCGIDNTVKLWTPCLNQPRPLDSNMLFSLGYNEVERSAESSMMRTGFGDMCKAFSKQRALQMVEQIKQQQELAAAAAAPAGAIA